MSKPNYMEKLDAWLDAQIDKWADAINGQPESESATAGFEAFKKAMKDKVLESYRNGQRSARRPQKENEPTSEQK